jgi:hypothetical protein
MPYRNGLLRLAIMPKSLKTLTLERLYTGFKFSARSRRLLNLTSLWPRRDKNGEERIRTSGYIAASSDFKSDAIDHSATSPKEAQLGLPSLNFTHL